MRIRPKLPKRQCTGALEALRICRQLFPWRCQPEYTRRWKGYWRWKGYYDSQTNQQ